MSCCQTQLSSYLQFGRHLHESAHDFFEEIAESSIGPRQDFLIEYLLKQEAHLDEVLKGFLKSTPAGVLNSWVDLKPKLDVADWLPAFAEGETPTTDGLSAYVFHYRDAWIDHLASAESVASDAKARELLGSLHRLEVNERNHLASALMQMDDL